MAAESDPKGRAERAYQVYCDIARRVYGHEPISREAWEAIPARSYFRSALGHDDGTFDIARDREGDAQ